MTHTPFIVELTTEYEAIAHSFFSIVPAHTETVGEFADTKTQLDDALANLSKDVAYSIAFVGQYSAGKSTIVSALTGRRDIQIDTNIATDVTSSYKYKALDIIDTPGLFTENKDHDERTYNAIEQSDLIVFCLTHSLFDPITLRNFEHLAYERGYASRMMLVVNKMSAEAGDYEDKVQAYTKTLEDTLGKERLAELKVVFIDAKDYIEGSDGGPDFLIEESNFDEFIATLDHFVSENGELGRAMTPLDILTSAVLDAQALLSRDPTEDDAYAQLLEKLSRRVTLTKEWLANEGTASASRVKSMVIELAATTWDELQEVKSEDEAANVISKLEKRIIEVAREVSDEFGARASEATVRLQDDFADVLSGDLSNALFDGLDLSGVGSSVNAKGAQVNISDTAKLRTQFDSVNDIAKKVGLNLSKAGQGANYSAQASGGFQFLKASQASGSQLHQGILWAGKAIGFKFKPWQAVNMAKNLANVGKALGPILAVAGFGLTLWEIHQEGQQAKKITDARLTLNNDLGKVGEELKRQFSDQVVTTRHQIFDPIDKQLKATRQAHYASISHNNDDILRLQALHERLDRLRDRLVEMV